MKIKEFIRIATRIMDKHNKLKRRTELAENNYTYFCGLISEEDTQEIRKTARARWKLLEQEYKEWMEKELTIEDISKEEELIG